MTSPNPQVNWFSREIDDETQTTKNKLAKAYLYILSDEWGENVEVEENSESEGDTNA